MAYMSQMSKFVFGLIYSERYTPWFRSTRPTSIICFAFVVVLQNGFLFQVQIRGIRRKIPISIVPPHLHVFMKSRPRPRRGTLRQTMLHWIVMYVIKMTFQILLVTNGMLIIARLEDSPFSLFLLTYGRLPFLSARLKICMRKQTFQFFAIVLERRHPFRAIARYNVNGPEARIPLQYQRDITIGFLSKRLASSFVKVHWS